MCRFGEAEYQNAAAYDCWLCASCTSAGFGFWYQGMQVEKGSRNGKGTVVHEVRPPPICSVNIRKQTFTARDGSAMEVDAYYWRKGEGIRWVGGKAKWGRLSANMQKKNLERQKKRKVDKDNYVPASKDGPQCPGQQEYQNRKANYKPASAGCNSDLWCFQLRATCAPGNYRPEGISWKIQLAASKAKRPLVTALA